MVRVFKSLILTCAAALAFYLVVGALSGGDEFNNGFDLAVARLLNSLDPYLGPLARKLTGKMK